MNASWSDAAKARCRRRWGAFVRTSSMIGFGPNITTSAWSPDMHALLKKSELGFSSPPAETAGPLNPGQSQHPACARQARIGLHYLMVGASHHLMVGASHLDLILPTALLDAVATSSIDFGLPAVDDWANNTNI